MRTRTRGLTLAVAAAGMLATTALPAAANHDHIIVTPGGCHTIPVSHQAHGGDDPGRKFHGGAHVGAAAGDAVERGVATLGKGNSQVKVAGDSPANRETLC